MKKRTISKLKSIFGSKKGKRQTQEPTSKSSRSPSPEPAEAASPANGDSFRPIHRTPPPSRGGPPPSPPVPTHPVAPVAPEPAAPQPLMPCLVCGRTFVPQSLAKHVKICEKMTVKKRKTFDSSRQRREGTDLEQYLPKNFGLPENSPFLEKSPPATAKPVAPKPKPQSVRSTITKPSAELQRCPHCQRAFGPRAFERHVEWCADKAKILPAAAAQPPPRLADAKQRLNARTQYKAPPVRGRRSSQTRDKSSNSRSASVESSRGVSPPPPRECGDYRRGRIRASESGSSNDCPDDASPHVPVIRNSRNSQNNSSGDANVKARQARLAKDLSSSRNAQEPCTSSVQQSNTDPNIKKNVGQNKSKNRLIAKKQQQLKKLEEIARKYSEDKQENKTVVENPTKKGVDKSQIPVSKNVSKLKGSKDQNQDVADRKPKNLPSARNEKSKSLSFKAPSEVSLNSNSKRPPDKEKKVSNARKPKMKIVNESTMSLDSLEENTTTSNNARNCQTIGINTELLCMPCKIHENLEQKKSARKEKNNSNDNKSACSIESENLEPKVKLLYKNPTLADSSQRPKENLSISYCNNSFITPSTSSNFISDSLESITNFESVLRDETNSLYLNSPDEKGSDAIVGCASETGNFTTHKSDEYSNNLSAENFDENYEHDLSDEMFNDHENEFVGEKAPEENEINARHGSGETYTKFTEDPADLEEFLAITDKLMSNTNQGNPTMTKDVEQFHTPATNSLESINKISSETERSPELPKHEFSDTFEELKSNLKELLKGAKAKDVIKKGDDILTKAEKAAKANETNIDTSKKVCDMEHITVYGMKFFEKTTVVEKASESVSNDVKLPSIKDNNKGNPKVECTKNRIQKIYKPNRKVKMLGEQTRTNKEYQTFIVKQTEENSDDQSVSLEAPPLKLPRIENKRLDENYDPFISAAKQLKDLMSSDTNIPKKIHSSTKDTDKTRTLPALQPAKEKSPSSYLRSDNTKMMKDTLNKTYQKTPTLQRMKSFGSTNNDNARNTLGGRCSSFRLNRNDKKPTPKLNTTFTKSSKENISTADKTYFTRNSNLNRSFSSYTASCYSTPKPKDKIPKIATSLYHSFQRSTIKQPVKLDKINREEERKDFVNLDAILTDDNSSMTDSNYIDPRLINENDNLPINVNTILNNPDIISSMESLLTTENLPAKFESFSSINTNNHKTESNLKLDKLELNCNIKNKSTAPILDDFSIQYDKLMHSLEQSIASKTSVRDDESLCEDFDLEDFMTSFDEEIQKHKSGNKRTCSSTTRVVKKSDLADSNRTSELNSISSSPKVLNGMIPVNKSMSLNFSSNNIANENLFPSSVKRSTSLLDSIQKKTVQKTDTVKSRYKSDQLEQDIMQSLKDFDKFYEAEKTENHSSKETSNNGTSKRDTRVRSERKVKKNETVTNGNFTPNGKASNDSAYSSLNRISPSKLSVCTPKEANGLASLDQIPGGSDSGGSHKEDVRSLSSEEFLAMERTTELHEPLPQPDNHPYKEPECHGNEKRASSRASSRRSPAWSGPRGSRGSQGSRGSRGSLGSLSSSGSEASLPRAAPRRSRFCHECGYKFPIDTANFCMQCGVRRLLV